MRQSPETNGKALDTVIAAIDRAIADYEKWNNIDNTWLRLRSLNNLKIKLEKYRLIIECGARY